MDILTGIASSNQKLTAGTAKDVVTPHDNFNSLLTDSMNLTKVDLPVAGKITTGTQPKAKITDTETDGPVTPAPAMATTDMSSQNILALLTQINAYQVTTSGKDIQLQTQSTSQAIATTRSAEQTAALGTTDVATPVPTPTTTKTSLPLAIDTLTAVLKKETPAESRDAQTALHLPPSLEIASVPTPTTTKTNLPLEIDTLSTVLKKEIPAESTGAQTAAHLPVAIPALLTPAIEVQQKTTPGPTVNTPFGKSGWTQDVAQQLVVMVKDKIQTISLALNPPNLGPLQVVVKIENQVANVQFTSAVPEVQQALRDGLPVLQDLLSQAGVELGQADIGNRQPQRGQKNRQAKQNESSSNNDDEFIQSINTANQTGPSHRQGLVNLYA